MYKSLYKNHCVLTNNANLHFSLGAGIYVTWSLGTATGGELGPQPSNSYAIIDTSYSNINSYTRFRMYCCSNSTSPSGSFTYPTGSVSSSSHWNAVVSRHSGSDTYAGCYEFYYYYYYWSSFYLSSYSGVYTCTISDSRGNYLSVNIGLYSEGFSCKSLTGFHNQIEI